MRLAKFEDRSGRVSVGILEGDFVIPVLTETANALSLILESADPASTARALRDPASDAVPLADVSLRAPLDQQEVWAAGVTYKRSMTARMEESESAATLYDKVYMSPRPELFFKATANRVVGTGGALRIRRDSKWNVPEPELALVLNSRMEIVAYTIGNDMSSRDIEGENPLYLPQAKVYDACCGLGPWLTLASAVPHPDDQAVQLTVTRNGTVAFAGQTNVSQMARTFAELIGWLQTDNSFPHGVILLTGTGIVPDSSFSLQSGDVVSISIGELGMLCNPIEQKP